MPYTSISFDDASNIVNEAGLSQLVDMNILTGGWANSNYKLSLNDNTDIVLKIWDEQTIDEVSYLLSITTYLSENNVPTPTPIPFSNGELLIVKDGKAWTLLPFIEGSWLEPNINSLYSLGRVQASLHLVKPPVHMKETYSMGYSLFEKLFLIADEKNEWSDFMIMLKSETTTLKQNIGILPKGIIHGDLFPDNILTSNNNINTILDFEEVCFDILAFDLVMTFVGCGWENGDPVNERWEALLQGYQSIRVLSQDEIDSLSDLHRLATLSIAAWRYWQFVINFPDTEHTDRYIEMVERLNKKLPF